jgi:tetratricopeptide (TPR) repeat protein
MSFCRHVVLSALLLAGLQAAIAQEQTPLVPPAVQIRSVAARTVRNQQVEVRKAWVEPVLDLYQQALLSVRNGRVSEAHEQLRARLREAPQDLAACRLLASLLLDNGQQAEAAQVLSAGQVQSPQSIDIVVALARIQAEQKAYLLALQTLERSAAYARQDAGYIAFMAVLASQAGQREWSIPLYQQALQLDASQGGWWLALGAAQRAVQDKAGARHSYESALALGLDSAQQRQARQALRQLSESAF